MARLHAITGNQWRPTVRIAGKNILGFGKTVRGCLANAAFVAERRYNSLKSSELLGQWPLIATNGICLVLQTQTDGSSDATASLGLAVSLCAVCRPIAVDHGFT